MRIAIIITGRIEGYTDNLISQYANIINNKNICKIISTCDNIDKLSIDKLLLNGFIVIQNILPKNMYTNSYNYQHWQYHEGIKVAKKLEYTHVLRTRTDLLISNINRFLDIYRNIYVNKPIFLAYYYHHGGYLLDYIYFFEISFYDNTIINYQNIDDTRISEKYLCETYFGTHDWSILKNLVTLSFKELLLNDIQIEWINHNRKGNIANNWNFNLSEF
jgi:hypothetical protein